jgi:hypothetical protein
MNPSMGARPQPSWLRNALEKGTSQPLRFREFAMLKG